MGREQQARIERKQERVKSEIKSIINRRRLTRFLLVAVLVGAGVGMWWSLRDTGDMTQTNDSATRATIETDKGNIVLELFDGDAPETVANFTKLAGEGFYEGTTFHRVIEDFMIQGGDPLSKDGDPSNNGTGGPGYDFKDEINAESLGFSAEEITALEAEGYKYDSSLTSHKMEKGVLAMANTGPDSNGSQFFIVTTREQSHLNGKHTVFGRVLEGLEIAQAIAENDVIKKITIEGSDSEESAEAPEETPTEE